MSSTMENSARRLSHYIYIVCCFGSLVSLILAGQMSSWGKFISIIYLAITVIISDFLMRNERISGLMQGRIEILLYYLVLVFFFFRQGWPRMFVVLFFFILCLFSIYQIPRLNVDMMLLTVFSYVVISVWADKFIKIGYVTKEELIWEFVILLFAEIAMWCVQKAAEFERRKVYENEQSLDDLLRVVELKCDEAQAAVRAKNDFLANMSHEIRTPLHGIMGMNEIIMRKAQQDDITEYARNIERAGKILISMVDDILDYSKMDSEKFYLEERPYSIRDITNELYMMMQEMAKEKGLKFELHMDEILPDYLIGDVTHVRQIMARLVSNAIKYTKQGEITLEVCVHEQINDKLTLGICVKDTGIGIRKEDLTKLFGAFNRIDLDKNRHIEGAGLGLSITKKLVEMCGGMITVHSEYGKGSEFHVLLPQMTGKSDIMEEKCVPNIKDGEVHKTEKVRLYIPKAKVLVVDDNPINRKVAKALLEDTGAQIDVAESGFACLDLVSQNTYDLILMDHMMPEMDGIQTLHKIRKLPENPNSDTRIVALTANAIAGARNEYIREGFDEYLSKPMNVDRLEELLYRFIPNVYMETETENEQSNQETDNSLAKHMESNVVDGSFKGINTDIHQECFLLYDELKDSYVKKLKEYHECRDWKGYVLVVKELSGLAKGAGQREVFELCCVHEKEIRRLRNEYSYPVHEKLIQMIGVNI